jgi:hypothetical protein
MKHEMMKKVRCNHFEELQCFLEVARNRCHHVLPHFKNQYCKHTRCRTAQKGLQIYDYQCIEVEDDTEENSEL